MHRYLKVALIFSADLVGKLAQKDPNRFEQVMRFQTGTNNKFHQFAKHFNFHFLIFHWVDENDALQVTTSG